MSNKNKESSVIDDFTAMSLKFCEKFEDNQFDKAAQNVLYFFRIYINDTLF